MGDNSSIEWTEATWNPVRGCTKISPGCKHCYAERFAERFRGSAGHPYERGFDLRVVPELLDSPVRWRRPRLIFVNSMSDLFHAGVPDFYIDSVFGVMWACLYLGNDGMPGHTFQVLTKRSERLREYITYSSEQRERWAQASGHHGGGKDPDGIFDQTLYGSGRGAHPRIWLGVSVENSDYRSRIDDLRAAPAAVRFLSLEPLLGPLPELDLRGIHWVIVGGESGPGARPMQPEWVRDIRDQCQRAGVRFFCKQLGRAWARENGADSKGGDMQFWPEDLRIREMPAAGGSSQ